MDNKIKFSPTTKYGGWSYLKKRILIDNFDTTEQILKHLELWDIRNHDPPKIDPVYIPELTYVEDLDYGSSGSQIPVFDEGY